MKKILLFILSVTLGLVLFIGVISYIGVDEITTAFKSFSWITIAFVIGLSFVQISVVNYRWKLVLEAQGDIVPFRKLYAPKLVGFTISFLTPGLFIGGEPVRAFLLKKQTGVRYSHGFASIIVDKILDFTYPLPFLIGALVYAMFHYDISWEAVSIFVVVLIGLVVLLILFYVQTYRGKGFFSTLIVILRINRFKRFNKIVDKMLYFEGLIITFFNNRKDVFIKGLFLSLLGGMVTFIQFIVILNALGIQADIIQILVIMVFMILAFFVPIPASLGSFEAGQVIIFTALGHPASIGVAFTLVIRMAELGKLAIGLTLLSNIGLKFLKDIPTNGNGKK